MKSENGCGIGAEFPHSHLLQLIFIIAFFLSWLLDNMFFKLIIPFGNVFIDIIRISFFFSFSFLAYLFIKNSGKVITPAIYNGEILGSEGIFARLRHPMYLGILMIYLAFVFLTMSLFCLITFIIICFLMNMMTSYEEKDLLQIFGRSYMDYMSKVPKWFPKLVFNKED